MLCVHGRLKTKFRRILMKKLKLSCNFWRQISSFFRIFKISSFWLYISLYYSIATFGIVRTRSSLSKFSGSGGLRGRCGRWLFFRFWLYFVKHFFNSDLVVLVLVFAKALFVVEQFVTDYARVFVPSVMYVFQVSPEGRDGRKRFLANFTGLRCWSYVCPHVFLKNKWHI